MWFVFCVFGWVAVEKCVGLGLKLYDFEESCVFWGLECDGIETVKFDHFWFDIEVHG